MLKAKFKRTYCPTIPTEEELHHHEDMDSHTVVRIHRMGMVGLWSEMTQLVLVAQMPNQSAESVDREFLPAEFISDLSIGPLNPTAFVLDRLEKLLFEELFGLISFHSRFLNNRCQQSTTSSLER